MTSLIIAVLSFAIIFSGSLLGFYLGRVLPDHHLADESRDVVKLGAGLIATLAALVLGLLVGSAKQTYDTMSAELTQDAAKILVLDRVLAQYGPETRDVRAAIRKGVAGVADALRDGAIAAEMTTGTPPIEVIDQHLRNLSPRTDTQRELQSRALSITQELAGARWLIVVQSDTSLPVPFLIVLVLWLTVIFASFGLFGPPNATVIVVLLLCALSAASAIFLTLEMDRPLTGLVRISDAPLRDAAQRIGK